MQSWHMHFQISEVASYGALGHVPPSPNFQQFHFYFTLEWIWQLTIQLLCNLQDKLVQMSPTHSSFDQYCISHKTISHRAAAAPGPEVYCECLKT